MVFCVQHVLKYLDVGSAVDPVVLGEADHIRTESSACRRRVLDEVKCHSAGPEHCLIRTGAQLQRMWRFVNMDPWKQSGRRQAEIL